MKKLLLIFAIIISTCYDLYSQYYRDTTICRNNVNKVIPDLGMVRDTIVIAVSPFYIVSDVNIKIDTVFHTWDSDLRFYLTHMTTGVRFINNVGGSGDNFIGTIINDSGACSIGSSGCNTAPFAGTYRPSAPANLFGFNTQSPNGTWILTITDTVAADTGLLKAWCLRIQMPLGHPVGNNKNTIPNSYSLQQNYPNPFNPYTKITYQLPKAGKVRLVVYDVLEREVKTLVNDEFMQAGSYTEDFNTEGLSSGVYYYQLTITSYLKAGESSIEFKDTKKMVLIK